MIKQRYERISGVSSGLGICFVLAYAATNANWAMWGACTCIAAAIGLLIGSYIEPQE